MYAIHYESYKFQQVLESSYNLQTVAIVFGTIFKGDLK